VVASDFHLRTRDSDKLIGWKLSDLLTLATANYSSADIVGYLVEILSRRSVRIHLERTALPHLSNIAEKERDLRGEDIAGILYQYFQSLRNV